MLVALLALAPGRVITTDRLIDQIYADKLPKWPVNALQALVSTLRRSLARTGSADLVLTTAGGYRLDVSEEQVDAARFCRLAAEGRGLLGSDPGAARLRAARRARPVARRRARRVSRRSCSTDPT